MIPGTPRTRFDYCDCFEGEVIDGPWQGRRHSAMDPYARAPKRPKTVSAAGWSDSVYIPATIECPYVEYVWVWSLGQWAMCY